ncbi:hypothetical protein B566_EDAN004458 [Ephemera danica]|nr:hypothetical protein B566_EDAN004458 [Ephemera danica]
MDTAIEVEFRELCRICANPRGQDVMIPIFEKDGIRIGLMQKINSYLPIIVSEDDGYPNKVCISCTSKLNVCDLLFQTCTEADARLKALKKQLDIETEKLKFPKSLKLTDYDQDTTDFSPDAGKTTLSLEENDESSTSTDTTAPYTLTASAGSKSVQSNVDSQVSVILSSEKHTDESPSVPKMNIVVVNVPKDVSSDKDRAGIIAEAELMQMQAAENFLRALEENLDEPLNSRSEVTAYQEETPAYSKPPKTTHKREFSKISRQYKTGKVESRSSHGTTSKRTGSEIRRSQRRRIKNKFYDSDTEITSSSCSFECKLCRKVFTNASGLRIHNIKNSHRMQVERLVCLSCDTKFDDVNAAEEHDCSSDSKVSCNVCGNVFSTLQEADLHKLQHSNGPFTCANCGDIFDSFEILQDHIIQHTREKPFQCNYCGKMFKSKIGLQGHQLRHTNSRTYVCYICHTPFSNREEMLSHRATHSKEEKDVVQSRKAKQTLSMKRFPCEICGKSLTSKAGLIVHIRMHKGEKPFECEQCGRRFLQAIKLKYHQRLHVGDLPYVCSLCEKRFNTQRQMDTHMRVHTNERPFICEICGMRFRSNGVLGRHKNTHSEEPLYACSFCGKRFRTRHATTVHERTHTGERRFMCDICGRSFVQKSTLDKHRLRHEKRRVECLECNTTFASRKGLRRHFEKKHTPVIVESIQMLDANTAEFVSVPIDDLVVEVVV